MIVVNTNLNAAVPGQSRSWSPVIVEVMRSDIKGYLSAIIL